VCQKAVHLTFNHNLGKRERIFKILSLSDSWGNVVQIHYQDCPPHLKYVPTVPCESWKSQLLPISMACCMWDVRIHLARYKAALVA